MPLYARRPARLAAQVGADLFVLVWGLAWWWISRAVHDAVAAVAEPARRAGSATASVADSVRSAGSQAGNLPGVGDQLRRPFDNAAGSLGDLVISTGQLVATIERLATLAGWLTFAAPVALVLLAWLPRRIAFALRSRAGRRLLDGPADLDLFALRALATSPLPVLARISDDPVAAWRAGDRAVVHQLAEIELRRLGLPSPPAAPRE